MKLALVEVDLAFLAEILPVLGDAGLAVTGVMSLRDNYVAVSFETPADILPVDCENDRRLVVMTFTREQYGSQRMTRVESIRLASADTMKGFKSRCWLLGAGFP
jgi:hypothetical protein